MEYVLKPSLENQPDDLSKLLEIKLPSNSLIIIIGRESIFSETDISHPQAINVSREHLKLCVRKSIVYATCLSQNSAWLNGIKMDKNVEFILNPETDLLILCGFIEKFKYRLHAYNNGKENFSKITSTPIVDTQPAGGCTPPLIENKNSSTAAESIIEVAPVSPTIKESRLIMISEGTKIHGENVDLDKTAFLESVSTLNNTETETNNTVHKNLSEDKIEVTIESVAETVVVIADKKDQKKKEESEEVKATLEKIVRDVIYAKVSEQTEDKMQTGKEKDDVDKDAKDEGKIIVHDIVQKNCNKEKEVVDDEEKEKEEEEEEDDDDDDEDYRDTIYQLISSKSSIVSSFACGGVVKSGGVPSVEIQGIGRLAFPLLDIQASEVIKVAEQAPFGKGT